MKVSDELIKKVSIIFKTVNETFYWSKLGKIQHLKMVKSMYIWMLIVPIIANVFSSIEKVICLNIYNQHFTLHLELPFSWKVFYFAAFCFFTANLIYFARCYSIFKENDDYADFCNAKRKLSHLIRYGKEVHIELKQLREGGQIYLVDTSKISTSPVNEIQTRGIPHEDTLATFKEEDGLGTGFWAIYRQSNEGRSKSRWLCGTLYALGLLGIALIIGQNLKTVVEML